MAAKKYRVKLTTEEQQELKALVSRGRAAAYPESTEGVGIKGVLKV